MISINENGNTQLVAEVQLPEGAVDPHQYSEREIAGNNIRNCFIKTYKKSSGVERGSWKHRLRMSLIRTEFWQ